MYTIFINDCVLYVTDRRELRDEAHFFYYRDLNLEHLLDKLESAVFKTVYLYDKDLNYLWKDFKEHFNIIEAAGGVVMNQHKEVLWIYRNQRWDLPKGKIEKGESKEIAAIREVEEECGIHQLTLKDALDTTYHIYRHKNKRVLKVTHWFKMYATDQKLTPQLDEGITKAMWFNETAMVKALKETYGNIQLLFKN